ncbi:MAG TPA: cytochrome c-type biogenesis protein CcmH [Candidatus Limnocylindria bacterium]|nr:cytochrome c-type biogenesis protein CcmH [Candidatus Limnocylindria bacterium]
MTRARVLILIALLAILGTVAWSVRPQDETPAERVDRIASELRCVTCQGLSVKDSLAPSARQMRDIITQRVAEGRTDQEIRAEFRASYGDWVFLSPSASSWAGLVWLVPLVALAAGLAIAIGRIRPLAPSAATPPARELAALRERVAREEALDLPQSDGAE